MTGGGSSNPEIVQVIADVFQCPAAVVETPSSAALGAALRAAHAVERKSEGAQGWHQLGGCFFTPVAETAPTQQTAAVYDQQLEQLESLLS